MTIFNFMNKLKEIDNECNESFSLWLKIVITVSAKLVATPLIF